MIRKIADFAPDGNESGVGLVLQNDDGHYLFFLAGTRHYCRSGELFYAGIGGHREAGEDWIMCAHRDAKEEIGTDIDILSVPVTWYVPYQGPVQQVEISDRPRPFVIYEMIHPPYTPRSGKLYRIVIFRARLHNKPKDLPPDEIQGVIALTEDQVTQSLKRKPMLSELLDEGALLITGEKSIDHQVRLYSLGTARALAHLFCEVDETKNGNSSKA